MLSHWFASVKPASLLPTAAFIDRNLICFELCDSTRVFSLVDFDRGRRLSYVMGGIS